MPKTEGVIPGRKVTWQPKKMGWNSASAEVPAQQEATRVTWAFKYAAALTSSEELRGRVI